MPGTLEYARAEAALAELLAWRGRARVEMRKSGKVVAAAQASGDACRARVV